MSFALVDCGLVHAQGRRALQAVTLAAAQGERVAVIGPSGAGKTTLLRVLGAALRPGEGTVALLDAAPWQLGRAPLRRLRGRIGTVHQQAPIPPRLRVVTAVLAGRLGQWPLWRALASLVYPSDLRGAAAVLAEVQLADRLFDRCDRLSGGQLQRVGIARVLYQAPDLLLADEPVSSLDPALADRALAVLAAQADRSGATLVASLHTVELALKWFPRIVGMREGRIVFDLSAAAVTPGMLRALYASDDAGNAGRDAAPTATATLAPRGGVARPDCL
ncbi:phosphonate ABC transporter ATP-binding protein [Xylophilus ampelinus]|uniref:Phosphonate transport system ATP-binding protein n=1 Tax=Xylophilus ampelinus TaxID=54067 RepID=A0A318SI79_9BURK|nr:ATP-binding cassette domain-containing protein [Xylophilus ampelinus]MCS4508668.1 ATP-binding cassette domain-containing protein [Xylophilus ampelinus]PYE74317.1 phosphonate transport system ATP-binding protein [Xylophilus ampelinus]